MADNNQQNPGDSQQPQQKKAMSPAEAFRRNTSPEQHTPGQNQPQPQQKPPAGGGGTSPQPQPSGAGASWAHLEHAPDVENPPDMDLAGPGPSYTPATDGQPQPSNQPGSGEGEPAGGEGSPSPQPGSPEHNLGRMRESYEAKLQTLQEQNQQLTRRLMEYDVTQSPEFQEQYEKPIRELRTKIGQAVLTFNGTEEQAQELLTLPPNERRQWIQENIPAAEDVLRDYFGQIDRHWIERGTALKDLEGTAQRNAQIRAQRQQQELQGRQESIMQIAGGELATLESSGFPPYVRTGNKEWDQKVEHMARYGVQVASSNDEQAKIRAILKGVTADSLAAALKAEREKRIALERRLGIASQVQPRNGQGAADGGSGQGGKPKAMTPGEAWNKNVGA